MNWITKLERKFGRYCIPNLISILIGGQILVYAVELFVNQYISFYLNLDRGALLAGQIWRVITFMFVPFSGGGPLSVVLGIYFTWFIGTALEKSGVISALTSISCWGCWGRCWPACARVGQTPTVSPSLSCWPLPCSTRRCRCCSFSSSRCG